MENKTKLPEISQKYVDDIFDELSKMQISLDRDPLRFGPRRLNEKIATTRNMLTRCEVVFNQVSHYLQRYKTEHRVSQLRFDLKEKNLLANDPEVRAGKNLKDREAVAHLKLQEDIREISLMETTIQNLDIVLMMVKAKRSDLRDVQGRIKDQMKLCQEDISIGRRWGNELDDAVRQHLNPKAIITPDMADEVISGQEHHLSDNDFSDDLEDIDALLRSVEENNDH